MININPVFEKEIKRNSRSARISWIVFGCNLVLGCIAIVSFFGKSQISGFMRAGDYDITIRCYMLMAYALFILLLLIIPAITAGTVSQERERGTLDVLLTTNLAPWKIITGKLQSVLAIVFLMAFSTMPAISLIMVFGGIGFGDLMVLIGMLVISGILAGSIGIFCSAVFQRTTIATIMSYVILVMLIGGTAVSLGLAYYIQALKLEQSELSRAVDLGAGIYVLLLNPFLTFMGMLGNQVGNGKEIANLCNSLGNYSGNFVVSHMVLFGAALQLIISVFLLYIAGRCINPLRRKKIRGFRKKAGRRSE